MSNDNKLNEDAIDEAQEARSREITMGYVAVLAVAVNIRAQMDQVTRPLNVLAAYAHMAGTLLAMAPAGEREQHLQQFLDAVDKTMRDTAAAKDAAV